MTLQDEINSGISHHKAGRLAEAEKIYRRILSCHPDQPSATYLLGTLMIQTARPTDAVELLTRAVQSRPHFADAHANLGAALAQLNRLDDAIAAYRQAIRLKPNSADAHYNLATTYKDGARFDEAIVLFQHAIRLNPNFSQAHGNLGSTLKSLGQIDEAIASLRTAVQLNPDEDMFHSSLVFALNHHPDWSPAEITREHRAWADQHAAGLANQSLPFTNERSPDRKLRIGYVSADFRRHAVGSFFIALPEHHDRKAVEVFCYSNVPRPDDMTERIKRSCDQWRNIFGLQDDAAAKLIRSDAIDILVDLSGHTSGNRLRVFARKPAPIQVTYLGYANTTGLATIDYRLTDALADPPGMTEHLNVEKLWRLPGCAWCYEPPEDAPEIKPRTDGLITFGCFNAFAKINSKLIAIWAELLKRVPESHLLLKSAGAGVASAQKRLMDEFAKHAIPADRIELIGWIDQPRRHMEFFDRIDIALDTFPYHGTTTTCEALWMGVPVVALAGNTHVSRVGVSLLNCVGLPELIAQSPDEYLSIASQLAANPSRLDNLRSSLRDRVKSSPLVDAKNFTANIETAFRQMWRIWCEAVPSAR